MIYRITLSFLFFSLAIKFIAITITNFDLFGDEAQYWLWSQKLDFGYYSKPPLLPWYISLYTYFLGNSFVGGARCPSDRFERDHSDSRRAYIFSGRRLFHPGW